MSRLLPYPLLALSLLAMWLLLNSLSLGHVVLGSVIGIAASNVTAALQPPRSRIRRWHLIPKLVGLVLIDVWRSNVAVPSC